VSCAIAVGRNAKGRCHPMSVQESRICDLSICGPRAIFLRIPGVFGGDARSILSAAGSWQPVRGGVMTGTNSALERKHYVTFSETAPPARRRPPGIARAVAQGVSCAAHRVYEERLVARKRAILGCDIYVWNTRKKKNKKKKRGLADLDGAQARPVPPPASVNFASMIATRRARLVSERRIRFDPRGGRGS